ncbi:MAG: energy transducer TonB [Sphingopyxis sp.]|uniref:hypothetical protein n=1 Tax=Sphingopyxis sp. TaxID=1908224 RepID=UPI001A3F5213|nr:hypothetical protein [Sphingopyxis sp.]MBL9065702.1 energy transducer TonB [Sphingopyxis sp.]
MADVLIVCVREDEPQAKALAEMFEAAGFSIGGAPSNDAALRSSGAGVIVWSQASIRSRPFLDAAQRVINAEKAVVASLIEPPPPSSIGSSPAFDLSQWDGDPNDPSLDPLFFAVDRMVNAARATAGAPVRQEDYPAPAPAPARTARAKPPAAQQPTAKSASRDTLDSEAEHWRAIRDSRDPTDFMDYLARYGPTGAFAEVAELKLKQLTGGPPSAPRARAPAAPPPATRPRVDAAVAPPPLVRRPEALPPTSARRVDVAAPSVARRMPPPERSYDRNDLREPPRMGGGPMRTFVLIALLGGGALAAGLYFGGGINFGAGNAATEQVADAGAAADSLDAPGDVPISEAGEGGVFIDPGPGSDRATPPAAARREAATTPTSATPRERTPQNPTDAALPPTNNFTSTGPISLSPGTSTQLVGPTSDPPPLPPEMQNLGSAPSTAASTTVPARAPGTVAWAQRPTARRIADLYPARALREGVGGRVQLDCVVQQSLGVNCSIASETPTGMGFASAALSAASSYRSQPRLSDGSSAVGARTRIAVAFQAPQ